MATAKSTTAEITEIQRRMARIRREMHEDVREAVKGAQSLTDWRSQVRNHPWLALGAATLVGYMLVPKRSPAPAIVAVAPAVPTAPIAAAPKKKRWGVIGTAVGLLGPVAVRAAQNYAIQYLEQWLAAQPAGAGAGLLGAGLFPGAGGPTAGAGPGGGSGTGFGPGTGSETGPRPSPPTGMPGWPRDVR